MAEISLTRAVLALASDPGTTLTFGTAGRVDERRSTGQVQRMANGHRRAVVSAGDDRTLTVTARLLTREQAETLDGWRGQTVLFRDPWGRKVYGVFWTTTTVDYKDRSVADVPFTLEQLSYDEAG